MPRLVCLLLALNAAPVFAEDWPGWRGPRRDGTADASAYPTEWNEKKNTKWKQPIPGTGHSSPIVVAGKVFLTTCVETVDDDKGPAKRMLLCLDRKTGEQLWARECLAAPLEPKHKLNSYASSTPVADEQRIYVTFHDQPALRVYCFDFAGKKLWDTSPGEFHSVHGFCSSPLIFKDLLIVNGDQDPKKDGKAYIVAFDKLTGKEKWRIDRANRLRSYCPPLLIEVAGKPQMVLTGSKTVCAFDPENGESIWTVKGPTEQFVASPVFRMVEGRLRAILGMPCGAIASVKWKQPTVFLTAGFPERWVMAIDPRGRGDVTKTHILWSKKNDGGYVPSPVVHKGFGYVITDEGIYSVWDLLTGLVLCKERVKGHQTGSPVVAGEHLYITNDEGVTSVLKTGTEYYVTAENRLKEKCYSSPAFSDGDIFLRGEKHLFCIGAGK